jgi:hypothetical protein
MGRRKAHMSTTTRVVRNGRSASWRTIGTWLVGAAAALALLGGCANDGVMSALDDGRAAETLGTNRYTFAAAEYQLYGWSDCTFTSIYVTAGAFTRSTDGGKNERWEDAVVSYYLVDYCDWDNTRHVSGYGRVPARDFTVTGRLGRASLTTALQGHSGEGGDVTIDVIVDWTGTGPIYEQKHTDEYDDGTFMYRNRAVSSYRAADAVGELSFAGASVPLRGMGRLMEGAFQESTKIRGGGQRPTAPVIHAFSSWPTTVRAGDAVWLTWFVDGSDPLTVTLAPGVGAVDPGAGTYVFPLETTTYTLTASNRRGTVTAELTIEVIAPPEPDGFGNDAADRALVIGSIPYEQPRMTIEQGTVDWFTFDLSEPMRVRVDVEADHLHSFQPMIGLFDEEFAPITSHDGYYGSEARIVAYLPAGTYFFAVTGYPDGGFDGGHWQRGIYRLGVTEAQPPDEDLYEDNDTRETAASVETFMYHWLALLPGDVDWYEFDVLSDGFDDLVLVVQTDPAYPFELHVVLETAAGDVLEVSSGSYHSFWHYALEPGTYRVGVTGAGDTAFTGDHTAMGNYSLGIWLYDW